MTGKIFAFLLVLCVGQLAFGDDLKADRAKALERLKQKRNELEWAYKDVCNMVENRPMYTENIEKQKRILGESLKELTVYEINKVKEGTDQKARVMWTAPKVKECIKAKKDKAVAKVEVVFNEVFTKPVKELSERVIKIRFDLRQKWSSQYHYHIERILILFDRIDDEVKFTTSKDYMEAAVTHFETVANDFLAKHMVKLEEWYLQNEIEFDTTLERIPLNNFRSARARIVDEYKEAAENCLNLV